MTQSPIVKRTRNRKKGNKEVNPLPPVNHEFNEETGQEVLTLASESLSEVGFQVLGNTKEEAAAAFVIGPDTPLESMKDSIGAVYNELYRIREVIRKYSDWYDHNLFKLVPELKDVGRLSIVVDGNNTFFAQRDLVLNHKALDFLDPVALVQTLKERVNISHLAWVSAQRDEDQETLFGSLRGVGFNTVSAFIEKANDTVRGNLDQKVVEECTYALPDTDTYLLFSGDKDFERLIEILHRHGKKVILCTAKTSLNWRVKNIADGWIPLEKVVNAFAKDRPWRHQYWWQKWKLNPASLSHLLPPEVVEEAMQEYQNLDPQELPHVPKVEQYECYKDRIEKQELDKVTSRKVINV